MQLMTKELEQRFKEIGSQEDDANPIVVAKYFDPCGSGTWLATEYDPVDKVFFGFAFILDGEFGYFSLEELEEVKGRMGLNIERDLYCGEMRISEHDAYKDNK